MKAEQERTSKVRIGWWGSAVLTVWITALVLMLSWGGSQYDWNSTEIIGLGATAVVGLILFLVIEHRAAEPVIPLRLFRSGNFSLANALGFIVGFAMFGGITLAALQSLPPAIQEVFKTAVTHGIESVFLWAAIIAAIGFVLALFIRHVPLRGRAPTPAQNAEATAEELAI